MKNKILDYGKKAIIEIILDIIQCIPYGIAVNMFTAPNHVAPGGVTGIATLVNYLTGLPIGVGTFIINIPLILLALKFLGKIFTLRTLKTLIILTLAIDCTKPFLPHYTENALLACLYGGVLMGLSLGLIFQRGTTTGGSDIVSRLLQKRYPYLQTGKILLMCDFVVIGVSVLIYGNIDAALYALIAVFVSSVVIDKILYGLDEGRVVLIMSDHNAEIAKEVISQLARGGTFLKGNGAYSRTDRDVLLCAVRRQEFFKLKKIVYDFDPRAFMVILTSQEVLGEGFKAINKD